MNQRTISTDAQFVRAMWEKKQSIVANVTGVVRNSITIVIGLITASVKATTSFSLH